jgi:hypothetical protein
VGSSDGQGSAPAGWFEDPDGRHQYRFWDGTAWTDHVADDGQQSLAGSSNLSGQVGRGC